MVLRPMAVAIRAAAWWSAPGRMGQAMMNLRRRVHSELAANLLIALRLNSMLFSEWTLKTLVKWPDFDSTIRRFESSRPSVGVLFELENSFLCRGRSTHRAVAR